MPVRFNSPSLGGQGETYLRAHEWQAGVAYRHFTANHWYLGTEVHNEAGPFGEPVDIVTNAVDLSLNYGITSRLSLALTVPFASGSQNRLYADLAHHEVKTSGLGDINLIGTYWLWDPATQPRGNIAVGLGVKAPTGDYTQLGPFYAASGRVADQPLDQSIQLGDGGWGIIVQAQALQQVSPRAYGYFFGSYLLNPRVQTGLPVTTFNGHVLMGGVPDIYQARLGMAYTLWPDQGLSASLGARVDGTPLRDIIGGGDLAFRRPAWILYADPGLALTRGRNNFTLSVPINLHADFRQSLIDREIGRPGGGDLTKVLLFVGYTRRF
jgi:hypothetical protein